MGRMTGLPAGFIVTIGVALAAGEADAACAAAEGSGTGFNTARASQIARIEAMRQAPASARGSVETSQPACYYLDNPNAAMDLVRCTVTASWCSTPPLPRMPGDGGVGRTPVAPPAFPPGNGGRYCGRLVAKATAGSLSRARTSVYHSIRQALQARGSAAGAPGVTVQEPACLYANERASQVTCTMTATYCR